MVLLSPCTCICNVVTCIEKPVLGQFPPLVVGLIVEGRLHITGLSLTVTS